MPVIIPGYAIFASDNYGPTFGGGHDFYINSDGSYGYSNLGYAYQLPSFLSDKIIPQGCIAKCLGNPSSFSTRSRYKLRFP